MELRGGREEGSSHILRQPSEFLKEWLQEGQLLSTQVIGLNGALGSDETALRDDSSLFLAFTFIADATPWKHLKTKIP